jgi:hypothetical protein
LCVIIRLFLQGALGGVATHCDTMERDRKLIEPRIREARQLPWGLICEASRWMGVTYWMRAI